MDKICRVCGIVLTDDNWYTSMSKRNSKICMKCNELKGSEWVNSNRDKHNATQRSLRYTKGGKSMSENKECTAYLGCYIAERVLANVFKDVESMPTNNPGFDFICNKGKKIDVKSGCTQFYIGGSKRWVFCIDKNKTPDYFLCLAFDNRTDLNPLYMWLLPADVFNHLTCISISENTINKWCRYRIDTRNVEKCCNKMKLFPEEFISRVVNV